MAIRPKRYESKGGRRVRAIKVTEKNYFELTNWAIRNGTNVHPEKSVAASYVAPGGDVSNQRLRLHLEHLGIRVARVGDYLAHTLEPDLSLKDGTLWIVKGKIFEEKYTEIKKPVPLAA